MLRKSNNLKKHIFELLLKLTGINGYKMTTVLKVKFNRNNKIYNKNIFILMRKQMKENINLEGTCNILQTLKYNFTMHWIKTICNIRL